MPRVRPLPVATCLAVAALALSQAACGQAERGTDRPAAATVPGPGLTIHRDQKRGYEVTFPSSWFRARENLTRRLLVDPREILTVATFPLRLRRSERCYPPFDAPVPALDRLGPRDALVSVQERIDIEHPVPDSRPRRFSLSPLDLHYRGRDCARRTLGSASFIGFADQGRQFYAFVALGRAASSYTRGAVRRMLDSLVFERRHQAPTRRLRFGYRRPYLGVSCRRPNRFECDRVGLTVWLAERAEQVVATIGGRQLTLIDRWRGRRFEGFLRPAGLLNGPLRVAPRPGSRRWLGDPPVYASVRISATYRDGSTATSILRVQLSAGYG